MEPINILKRDGVFTMDNPADAEPSNEAIDKLIQAINRQDPREYLVGREFDSTFAISEEIAMSIIRVYGKNELDIDNVKDYTITTVRGYTMLVARNAENICLWTLEIPKEVMDITEGGVHFEEDLAAFKEMNEEYKKVRIKGIIFLVLLLGVAAAVYITAWYLTGVPASSWR